jgi:predicted permease
MTHWLRTIWSRSLGVVRKDRLDREFDEELTTHLELLIDEGRRRGMSHTDARREALRRLGGFESIREVHREQRGVPVLDALAQDLRYAVRMLWKSPAFACIVTLSLALGIGGNIAVFSVISAAFLNTLPISDPETLTLVQRSSGTQTLPTVSYTLYEAVRDQSQSFRALAAFNGTQYGRVYGTDDSAARTSRQYVSSNYFEVAGVRAIRGRTFDAADNRTVGASPVAVISHRYWSSRLGSDENVVGGSVTIDDRVFTIIGVSAPGFTGVEAGRATDVWLPTMMMGPCVTDPGCQVYRVMGRLQPGVTESAAAADLTRILASHLEQRAQALGIVREADRRRFTSQRIVLASGMGGDTSQVASTKTPLTVLMGLVAIILLISCTNVGSLLLARAVARRREMAVRLSIGARRGRLIRQLLTESLVIALAGGVTGLVLASWASQALVRLLPQAGGDLVLEFHLDRHVLIFTATLSLLSTLLFGLAPAVQSTRADLTSAFKDVSAATAGQSAGHQLRHAFVVVQLGLSVLLLVAAGLFARTLRNLELVDVGYDAAPIVTTEIRPPDDWKDAQTMAARDGLIERVRATPGLASAAVMGPDPFGGNTWESPISIPAYVPRSPDDLVVNFFAVSSDLFATMRVPILAGRNFTPADRTNAPLVAIVNQAFVRRFGGGRNVIGTTIEKDAGRRIEIVGVVRDANFSDLRQRVGPIVFLSAHQRVGPSEGLVVRAATASSSLVQALRAIGAEMQGGLRLAPPIVMRERLAALVQPEQRLVQLWGGSPSWRWSWSALASTVSSRR